MCQEVFPIRKQWMNSPQLCAGCVWILPMLQGSVSDIKADLGLCLLSAVNVCHPPLSTLNITLFYPPKNPKQKNQKHPKTNNQTNQPTFGYKFCSALNPKSLPARNCCLFSSPGRDREKFCRRLTQIQLGVGDLLQISPCSIPAVTYPFLATKPQMHPHATSLAVAQGTPRPVLLSREEGLVHRSL